MGLVACKSCSQACPFPMALQGFIDAPVIDREDEEVKPVPTKEEEAIEQQKRAAVGTRKRASVSAPSVTEDAIKAYKCPSYGKPDSVKQLLEKTLTSHDKMKLLGLDRLKKDQLEELIMAFSPKTIQEGVDVIKQGDVGDYLYILEEGTVDIFVARKKDDGSLDVPTKVANFPAGALFGELALMYQAPRAATVRCATPTAQLWCLDREPFQMMLKKCGLQMVEQYSGWLTQVEILKVLNLHEISQLADVCESMLVDQDEELITQGDEGDAFYILEEGECAAFIKTPEGEEKMVKKYTLQGEYFGELALINNAPRKATVRAISDAVVLKIEKQTFDDMLGPLNDRLLAQATDLYK